MAKRKTNKVSVPTSPRKTKEVKGNANKLKKLNELQKVNKELEKRSKVSGALFDKRRKLMGQLGMDREIF